MNQLLAEGPLLPRGNNKSSAVLPSNNNEDIDDIEHQPRQKRQQQHNEETGLFGKSSSASKLAKKRQDQSKAAAAKKVKVEDEKEKEARRLQTRLTLSRVTKGMKLLGCVTRVTKDKVVLQLCNNMTCVVAANEVSDEHFDCAERGIEQPSTLKDAVPVNRFVPLVVLDTDGMIKCSMRCSLLNKAQLMQIPLDQTVHLFASVRSVEDHGVILNLGLRHLQGFLPFSAGISYVIGQCGIEVAFQPNKAINGMVTVKLVSVDTEPHPVPSFASLFPGTNVAVSRMVRDDLLDGGSLFSIPVAAAEVQAVCDWAHSPTDDEVDVATVLWVDSTAKTLGLSFLPHIVNRLRERFVPSPLFKVGDLVHDAKVVRLQTRIGLVLEKDKVPFFASVNRLVDAAGGKNKHAQTTKENLPSPAVVRERFGLDTVHTLRVLEANPMEATLVCSLQDSAVLTGGETIDLTPGRMISARVVKIDPRLGLFVQVAHSCRGLVTLQHLGDSTSNTQDISKRFRVDQELKAMILSHTEEKTYFTLKKSLMTSTLPIVTAYDLANVGIVTLGTVVKVDSKFGLILTFFNNVQGLIPLHDLGENVVKDMHDLYRVGQVVKVKVLQVNKELERMRLSLKTTSALPTTAAVATQAMQEEDPTMVSVGTVVNKLEDAVLVEFKCNEVLLRGSLHKMHLSDFPSLCDAQFEALRVGSKVRNFMVLDSKRKPFSLTLKQELIAQAKKGNLPSKLEQVSLDEVYTCAVHNKQDFGVFVHFAGGLTGFVPRANVSDNQAVQHPALETEHATVRVLVTAVDSDKQRMTCSLKPSVVGGYAQYLTAWLQATRPLLNKWRNVEKLVCTVTHRVENVGVALSVAEEEGYSAFCAIEHCPGGKLPEVGQTLTFTRVLDVNFDTKVIDVSARKSLKSAVWRTAEEEEAEEAVDVEVELWRREYCVVSYRAKRGDGRILALVSLVSFNQTGSNALPIKFGTKLQCLIVPGFAVLERDVQQQQPMTRTTRSRSGSLTEFLGPKVKVELNAVIPVKIRDIRGCWARLDVRADMATSAVKIKQAALHSCDVLDPVTLGLQDAVDGAFAKLSVGDVVQAKVVEIAKNKTVYFSLRPTVLASEQDQDEVFSWEENRLPEKNKVYDAWVDEVLSEGIMVGLSRHMRGYCVAMHVSNDLQLLDDIFNSKHHSKQVLPVGRPVRVEVLDVDAAKKRIEVRMVWE